MRIRSARLTAVPSGRRDETGFTLVEIVIALTVLAVGIVGVIGVTNSSLKTAGAASVRNRGVAIATRELERFRAIPYSSLPGADRTSTNAWTSTGAGTPYGCAAVCSERVGGTNYSWTNLLWQDASLGYRIALVRVTWRDTTGNRVVEQASRIYPGGIGPTGVSGTSNSGSNCTPPSPGSLGALLPGGLIAQTAVDLYWTVTMTSCPIESFVVQYSRDNFATSSEVTRSAFDRAFRVTGLSAGVTYQFRVASKTANGEVSGWSPSVTIATAASISAPCEVGIVTVTPSYVSKKARNDGSGLEQKVTVDVPTTGTCTGFKAIYYPVTNGTAYETPLTQSGSTWSGALAWNTASWDVGKHYVDVKITATNQKIATILLTVCEKNTPCG